MYWAVTLYLEFTDALHYLPLKGCWEDSREKRGFFLWIFMGEGGSWDSAAQSTLRNCCKTEGCFLQTQKVSSVFYNCKSDEICLNRTGKVSERRQQVEGRQLCRTFCLKGFFFQLHLYQPSIQQYCTVGVQRKKMVNVGNMTTSHTGRKQCQSLT